MKTTRSTYARREVVDAARRRRAEARAARAQLQGTAELVDYFITQPERDRLERVIKACAEEAVRYYMTPGIDSDFAIAEVRRVVTEAGRRAAKGAAVSQAAGPVVGRRRR